MKDFFIYSYSDAISFKHPTTVTVLFVHQKKYDRHKTLIDEIEIFFQSNILTNKFIILLPSYADADLKGWFTTQKEQTFRRVPGISEAYFEDNYIIIEYNSSLSHNCTSGKLSHKNDLDFYKNLYRHGSTQIFVSRGGLVESSPDHHFVFPSGKHCAKFIRTGNVLVNSAETFFLAIQLLPFFIHKSQIFCDTSSINVLPFAVLEIVRRFDSEFKFPTINSFESYSIFEKRTNSFAPDALVLISSSTSGNIIDRLLKSGIAKRDQLIVLFFLGSKENYNNHEANIICNLTGETSFPIGVTPFQTYNNKEGCELCKAYSRPIRIHSDVFLTVQPKIEKITLKVTDAPTYLGKFIECYKGNREEDTVLKNYYRREASTNGEYEVFIDTQTLFKLFPTGKFTSFGAKIKRKINTNIPANVKYLLHLADEGSVKLAEYIQNNIDCSVKPDLIHIDDLLSKIEDVEGSVVIVASSIVTGRHLLHISRLLRKRRKLSLIYFIGISRSSNQIDSQTLKSNLGRGADGANTYPVIAVEEIYCDHKKTGTSWEKEKIFFENMLGEIDEDGEPELFKLASFRHSILLKNKETNGFINNVLLPEPNGDILKLRKGFAFWNFEYAVDEISQSEVYFTVSSIINHLKHKDITSPRSLQQSNYVRNLLAPENFHRFNDGIIQASLLRSADSECFAYDLDSSASLEMRTLVESMFDQINTPHSEAILEFLLAIGLKKLRLLNADLLAILELGEQNSDLIVSSFCKYLKAQVS